MSRYTLSLLRDRSQLPASAAGFGRPRVLKRKKADEESTFSVLFPQQNPTHRRPGRIAIPEFSSFDLLA